MAHKVVRVAQPSTDDQAKFEVVPVTDSIGGIRMPERFAAINQMILRDLNGTSATPTFYLYTKDQIQEYIKNPYANEKNLRDAVVYLYGASAHFRRLIQYFVSLNDLSYVVSPYRIDTATANHKTIKNNYRRVLNLLASMDLKNQMEKVLTVCFREDVFYGTIREGTDSTIIQQLPSEYCKIAVIEDNVCNVSFDFSYFSMYAYNLPLYPEEFQQKYKLYQKDNTKFRWQMLDSPNSFAIKANKDILTYAMPPFAGILRDLYDIEDYRALKLSKTEIENYAMLVMKLGIKDDGGWEMDLGKAKEFWRNLDGVLPEEIGSILTPMPVEKISFERTHTGDTNTIAEAEQSLYTAAGVSSLLFNNEKASANALELSIKVDQAMTYSIVKSIECMLNRFIHRHGFGKYFKVTMLDVSRFNRKEESDRYLKAAQYGLPTVSYFCAANGISQDEMDCLNFLEDDVLQIKERFTPLQSSNTQSAKEAEVTDPVDNANGDVGRPLQDEVTEEGERTREAGDS